jgi:hypothetical protein
VGLEGTQDWLQKIGQAAGIGQSQIDVARYQALMRLKLSASQRVQPGDVVEIGNAAQAAELLALGAIREPEPQAPAAPEAGPAERPERPAQPPRKPRARKAAPAAAPAPADGDPT